MKLNVAGLKDRATHALTTAWNVISLIWMVFMLLGATLVMLAVVVGGIAAIVWMWSHDGPLKFATTLVVCGVMFALLQHGLELLDRTDSSNGQAGC